MQADEAGPSQSTGSVSVGGQPLPPVEFMTSIINTNCIASPFDETRDYLESTIEDDTAFGDTVYYDGVYHDDAGNPIHFSAGTNTSLDTRLGREELLHRQLDWYGVLNAEEDGQQFHRGVDLDDLLGGQDDDDATKTNVEVLARENDSGEINEPFVNLALICEYGCRERRRRH